MAISGRWVLDLANPKLLEFIAEHEGAPGKDITINPDDLLDSGKLKIQKIRPEPGDLGEYTVVTWIKRKYHILKDGQVISEVDLDLPRKTVVSVNASTVLAENRDALSQAEVDFLEGSFVAYNPGVDKPIVEYTINKLTEYEKNNPPINDGYYDLFPVYKFLLVSTMIDLENENRMKKKFIDPQIDGRLPGQKEGGSIEGSGYTYRFVGDSEATKKSVISDDYLVSVPDNATPEQVEEAIRKRAMDDATQMECTKLTLQITKVKEIQIWEDIDWPLTWVYRKICGGAGFHTYWPIEHRRTIKHWIYATLFYPSADNRKAIIEEVFNTALATAVVVAWITADIKEAVKAFKQTFYELLRDKTIVAVECVMPSFYIAEIHEDWRRTG